jgi:hypothetical protein
VRSHRSREIASWTDAGTAVVICAVPCAPRAPGLDCSAPMPPPVVGEADAAPLVVEGQDGTPRTGSSS